MSPEHVQLFQRIAAFQFDESPTVTLTFAARLARENGWSRRHAERVIEEYKRFILLAMVASRPVCPSEDVDAAWHLHLTYTRSYWKRFCGEVLGKPLHHDPTQGGAAEADKHLRMYEETLAAYRQVFLQEPPADIWPPARQRFGIDLKHTMVNTARHWIVPKAPIKKAIWTTAAGLTLVTVLPGCMGGDFNPFNLVGTDFLYVLLPMMLAAVIAARLLRWPLRGAAPQAGDDRIELSWEQTAYLSGNDPRLVSAAIARLIERSAIQLNEEKSRLVPGSHLPDESFSAVEKAVYAHLPIAKTAPELKLLKASVEAAFAPQRKELEERGLLLSAAQKTALVLVGVMPITLVMLFLAVPRIIMGSANHKPIDYLLAVSFMGGLLSLVVSLAGNYHSTRRGASLIIWLRSQNADLANRYGLGTPVAALAVALFGTTILGSMGLQELQTWFPRRTSVSDGGCGSGCTGGGGCGGGDGGGGGCGGCGG